MNDASPSATEPRDASSGSRSHRLHQAIRFAFPQRNAIGSILFLTLISAATNAVEPLILKWLFDELAATQKIQSLFFSLAILAVLALARELSDGTANWLTWRTRIGLQYALLEATVGKLHRMPLRIQRSEGIGAILTRLDRSIQGFSGAVTLILFNILPSVIFLVIAVVIMLNLDWRLAAGVLVLAPLPALIATRAAPEQTKRERTLLDRWARIYSRFNEVLSGILIVRSFAMEDVEKSRFLRDVDSANRVVIKGVATDAGYTAASNLIVAVGKIWAIGFGGYLVLMGEITLGTVVAFLGYVGGLFGPVQGLSGVYTTLRRASVSLDEIFKILDVQEHLGDPPNAANVQHVRGEIAFENVHFRYEDSQRPLLDGVTFHVEAGQTVAIVGPSGSGKTTLMALLMRFYDPEHGRILVDGRDLRSVKQSSLRRQIGVVLQDPLLFNDTIRANIAYGRPDATEAEIKAASLAANANEFIARFPDGYETIVGERGALLSLGERQRITIARALVKDPPVLILDEPTSSLDAESEKLVHNALERMMMGRTTLVIAHRLATVIHADRILVLKDGRIVESGTHTELLMRGGYYTSVVMHQSLGMIPNDTVRGFALERSS
jgi:ATP-binding cassette, subfamily B, bacterial